MNQCHTHHLLYHITSVRVQQKCSNLCRQLPNKHIKLLLSKENTEGKISPKCGSQTQTCCLKLSLYCRGNLPDRQTKSTQVGGVGTQAPFSPFLQNWSRTVSLPLFWFLGYSLPSSAIVHMWSVKYMSQISKLCEINPFPCFLDAIRALVVWKWRTCWMSHRFTTDAATNSEMTISHSHLLVIKLTYMSLDLKGGKRIQGDLKKMQREHATPHSKLLASN